MAYRICFKIVRALLKTEIWVSSRDKVVVGFKTYMDHILFYALFVFFKIIKLHIIDIASHLKEKGFIFNIKFIYIFVRSWSWSIHKCFIETFYSSMYLITKCFIVLFNCIIIWINARIFFNKWFKRSWKNSNILKCKFFACEAILLEVFWNIFYDLVANLTIVLCLLCHNNNWEDEH